MIDHRLRLTVVLLLGAARLTPAAAQDVPASSPAYTIPCDELTELNSVYFAEGSAALDGAARARLAENIVLLQRCPSVTVSVSAYTDPCGGDGDRLEVSARRAAAVRNHYFDADVAPDRVGWCVGRGEDAGSCGTSRQERIPRGRRTDTVPLNS